MKRHGTRDRLERHYDRLQARAALSSLPINTTLYQQDPAKPLRFVSYRTKSGFVFEIPVRADGKVEAKKAAQAIVDTGELCGALKYVEVS